MARGKLARGSNAILFAVLAIGILVLINLVASRTFSRVDLTADKIYTISDASRRLVANLPDRLTVKAFISSDLPPQVRGVARYLRDILEEYATGSKGRMVWEVIDPRDDKTKEEARRLKVSQARLSVFEKTKASVTESYLGVAFQYGGKVESLPFVSDVSNLEYQISSAIRRLSGKKRKVGFTSGHGEPSLYQGLQAAHESLKDYDVQAVDLTEGKTPIPADIDVLVMVGPAQRLAERAKYELDQFLMKGKGLALLLDGMVLETPRGQFAPGQTPPRIGRANAVGLSEQLEHYGLRLREDLVMDRQNARVVLPAGPDQRVITNYPGFPVVTNLSRSSAITRNLKAFIPIFASSLELMPELRSGKGPVTATVLATCSPASWRQTGFFFFDPLRQPQPTKELGPFNLAFALQGSFKSFFAGRPVPAPGPAAPPTEKEQKPSGKGQVSPAGARLVVVSDSDFIKDQFLGIFPQNLMLLQNIVDYLAEDESLIAIRAKAQTHRPLRQVEDSTVTLAKYGNIIGVPLLLIGFGLARWRVRRASRERRAATLVSGSKRAEPKGPAAGGQA
jgi:gliding-associated putative ABC transporter substrate-binding component GldG